MEKSGWRVFSLVTHVVAVEAVDEENGQVFGCISGHALHVGQNRVGGGAVSRQILVIAVVASVERPHSQINRVDGTLKVKIRFCCTNTIIVAFLVWSWK